MQFTILCLLLFHFRSFYRRIRDPLGGLLALVFGYCSWLPFSFFPPKLWWLLLYTPVYCINFISCNMPVLCCCCCCCCPPTGKRQSVLSVRICLVSLFLLLTGPPSSFIPHLALTISCSMSSVFKFPRPKLSFFFREGSTVLIFELLTDWVGIAIRQHCTVLVHTRKKFNFSDK